MPLLSPSRFAGRLAAMTTMLVPFMVQAQSRDEMLVVRARAAAITASGLAPEIVTASGGTVRMILPAAAAQADLPARIARIAGARSVELAYAAAPPAPTSAAPTPAPTSAPALAAAPPAAAAGGGWRAAPAPGRKSGFAAGIVDELRLGGSLHDQTPARRSREGKVVDLNLEILFDSPNLAPLRWIGAPRPHLGGTLNGRGQTSYGYAGLTWEVPLWGSWFLDASFGGAVHNGKLDNGGRPNRASLGSHVLFRESLDIGYRWQGRHSLSLYVDHISNYGLARPNQGMASTGLRYGYRPFAPSAGESLGHVLTRNLGGTWAGGHLGLYGGAQGGYAFGHFNRLREIRPSPAGLNRLAPGRYDQNIDSDDGVIGAFLGLSWQTRWLYAAAEIDYNWGDIGQALARDPDLNGETVGYQFLNLKTATLKAGFSLLPWLTLYGKGGYAGAKLKIDQSNSPSLEEMMWGPVVGAGMQIAVWQGAFLRADYSHIWFPRSATLTNNFNDRSDSYKLDIDLLRIGLGWQF